MTEFEIYCARVEGFLAMELPPAKYVWFFTFWREGWHPTHVAYSYLVLAGLI